MRLQLVRIELLGGKQLEAVLHQFSGALGRVSGIFTLAAVQVVQIANQGSGIRGRGSGEGNVQVVQNVRSFAFSELVQTAIQRTEAGMLEYWNVGKRKTSKKCLGFVILPSIISHYSGHTLPKFHHSNIPIFHSSSSFPWPS